MYPFVGHINIFIHIYIYICIKAYAIRRPFVDDGCAVTRHVLVCIAPW